MSIIQAMIIELEKIESAGGEPTSIVLPDRLKIGDHKLEVIVHPMCPSNTIYFLDSRSSNNIREFWEK